MAMILRSLYDFAQREGLAEDLDYELKELRWALVLTPKGAHLEDLATLEEVEVPGPKGKKKTKTILRKLPVRIPRQSGRTSADVAEFLVDKADYVFGWDPSGKTKPTKLPIRAGRYRNRVEHLRRALQGDSFEARAVDLFLAFLSQPPEARSTPLREKWESLGSEADRKDLATAFFLPKVALEGKECTLHFLDSVETYWRTARHQEEHPTATCVVTGKPCVPTNKHDGIKNLPGGNSAGAKLISFNTAAFESYGWEGNANAAISREVSEACSSALNRLLHPRPKDPSDPNRALPVQHVHLSEDSVATFWADDGDASWVRLVLGADSFEDDPGAVPEPDRMLDLFLTPWKGKMPLVDRQLSDFYTLILSGAEGRCVVHAYGKSTTGMVAQRWLAYWKQAATFRPFRDIGTYPLSEALKALVAPGSTNKLPQVLAAEVYMAIFEGRPLPLSILDAALLRNRTETEFTDRFAARCGLIQLCIPDACPPHSKERPMALDLERKDPPYVLGRLLAILDRIQKEAVSPEWNKDINAPMAERYFGSASLTPGAIFPQLMQLNQHHLNKVRSVNRDCAGRMENHLYTAMDHLEAFPPLLDPVDQGVFAIGFHHQRAWNLKHFPRLFKPEIASAAERSEP